MMRYASNTNVSEGRSRAEIERLLMRYGAEEFGYVTRSGEAMIGFVYRELRVQMAMPLPSRSEKRFTHTPGRGGLRTPDAAITEWQKEVRRRWRSLCLVVKALLVGIDDGVLTFEQAFMPWVVWGNGLTTSQMILPHIKEAIDGGHMPKDLKQLELLP